MYVESNVAGKTMLKIPLYKGTRTGKSSCPEVSRSNINNNKNCSEKFRKTQRKALALASLFSKIAGFWL